MAYAIRKYRIMHVSPLQLNINTVQRKTVSSDKISYYVSALMDICMKAAYRSFNSISAVDPIEYW